MAKIGFLDEASQGFDICQEFDPKKFDYESIAEDIRKYPCSEELLQKIKCMVNYMKKNDTFKNWIYKINKRNETGRIYSVSIKMKKYTLGISRTYKMRNVFSVFIRNTEDLFFANDEERMTYPFCPYLYDKATCSDTIRIGEGKEKHFTFCHQDTEGSKKLTYFIENQNILNLDQAKLKLEKKEWVDFLFVLSFYLNQLSIYNFTFLSDKWRIMQCLYVLDLGRKVELFRNKKIRYIPYFCFLEYPKDVKGEEENLRDEERKQKNYEYVIYVLKFIGIFKDESAVRYSEITGEISREPFGKFLTDNLKTSKVKIGNFSIIENREDKCVDKNTCELIDYIEDFLSKNPEKDFSVGENFKNLEASEQALKTVTRTSSYHPIEVGDISAAIKIIKKLQIFISGREVDQIDKRLIRLTLEILTGYYNIDILDVYNYLEKMMKDQNELQDILFSFIISCYKKYDDIPQDVIDKFQYGVELLGYYEDVQNIKNGELNRDELVQNIKRRREGRKKVKREVKMEVKREVKMEVKKVEEETEIISNIRDMTDIRGYKDVFRAAASREIHLRDLPGLTETLVLFLEEIRKYGEEPNENDTKVIVFFFEQIIELLNNDKDILEYIDKINKYLLDKELMKNITDALFSKLKMNESKKIFLQKIKMNDINEDLDEFIIENDDVREFIEYFKEYLEKENITNRDNIKLINMLSRFSEAGYTTSENFKRKERILDFFRDKLFNTINTDEKIIRFSEQSQYIEVDEFSKNLMREFRERIQEEENKEKFDKRTKLFR